ncbi:lipopolysaccharide biosynthesis protein [Tenacibaculum aiptasiae]|uniref:lipopolysaccharide biosynthesis protein n=1 Tax=Tenacibaculum aiptasiae TaxID=426481 RepID=UPI0023314E8B|nr:polysaccharide biosynthesis C-terminal domain-containing protein [Tenacibaculum aiptasiae]
MSRADRLKKNTISSLLYQALAIIAGLIVPRLVILYYGSSINGLVYSITSFLGFITILDLGIGAVISSNLYKPLAEKNLKKINEIFNYARKFYNKIAFILILYTIALIFIYPRIANEDFGNYFIEYLIVIIAISVFAQYFFGITYTLLLQSDQKQYIYLYLNSVILVLNVIITIILITSGLSIHIVKLSAAIIFFLKPLVLSIYVKRNYDITKNIKIKTNPIEQKWNGIAQHLAYLIQDKTDIIVLTWFSTLGSISIYSIYYMIVSGVRAFIYASTSGFSSLIGNMIAKNETQKLKNLFEKFEWLTHTISTLLFTTTGILLIPFVAIYTKGVHDINYILPVFAVLMSIGAAVRCFQLPYNIVVQAALHFKETQKSAIIEPIINLLTSIILVIKLGLVGVAIGTFISISYRTIYLAHYLSKNIIKIDIKNTYKLLLVDIISVICMTILTSFVNIDSHDYFLWSLSAALIFTINIIITIIINLFFYKRYILRVLSRGVMMLK